MPPQIKHDLNASGHESTDFPSVCEKCLPDNPYVQMLKEDYGATCKVCTRPFTLFNWKGDRTARQKRTIICLTCARLKNCCQCCMLDLSFGLPITIRDAALKMIAPGPNSTINREYYAQEHEKEIEEGRGAVEAYGKTDEMATELLRKLARSEPYRRRRIEEAGDEGGTKALPASSDSPQSHRPGPIRTQDSRGRGARGPVRGGKGRVFPSTAQLPPTEEDWLPPADQNMKSLFITGVEDDLPEHKIRTFFSEFGTLQSVQCSHRSHCAFINYISRQNAEKAAESCRGKAIIAGCPLRVTWRKGTTLDTMDRDQRMANARAGRGVVSSSQGRKQIGASGSGSESATDPTTDDLDSLGTTLAPPGSEDVVYASLAGN